jgi:hypothetical protein
VAVVDSGRAIGAVTRLLQDHLLRRGFEVSIGRPEQAARNNTAAKLNLFLYESVFDGHLRNHTLREGEPAPLWLVLKYLLTAFDKDEDSDSADAHELLGRGVAALHELNVLRLDPLVAPEVRLALEGNPQPLRLTFDESSVDLLSKLTQGGDERYRLSVAFQMRPVMIAPASPPHAALLVGVDYTTAPETPIGKDGLKLEVQPSMGPRLRRVEPARFEAGSRIVLFGDDLTGADLEVVLGDVVLTTVERHPDHLVVTAEGDAGGSPPGPIASGATLSAGEIPLLVRRRLSPTRTRSSDLLLTRLLPTLKTAVVSGSDVKLGGLLLGRDADDVVVSFYRQADGVTVRTFDAVDGASDQQTLTVTGAANAVPAGTYRVILRVNNQQAKASPPVTVP